MTIDSSVGLRFDHGKLRLDLVSPEYWLARFPKCPVARNYPGFFYAGQPNELSALDETIRLLDVPLEKLAAVYETGSRKYSEWNWLKGMAYSRLLGPFCRHFFWKHRLRNETHDDESKCPHTAHAVWNLVTLRTYITHGLGTDNRPCINSGKKCE